MLRNNVLCTHVALQESEEPITSGADAYLSPVCWIASLQSICYCKERNPVAKEEPSLRDYSLVVAYGLEDCPKLKPCHCLIIEFQFTRLGKKHGQVLGEAMQVRAATTREVNEYA